MSYCNGPGDDRPLILYAVTIRGTGLITGSSAHVSRYYTDDTLYVANPGREGRSRDNSWLQFNGFIQTKQRHHLSHTTTKHRRELFPSENT